LLMHLTSVDDEALARPLLLLAVEVHFPASYLDLLRIGGYWRQHTFAVTWEACQTSFHSISQILNIVVFLPSSGCRTDCNPNPFSWE
jgi:hypothetical protein